MKYIFLLITLNLSIIVNAQKSITLDEVGKHIGDSVKVCDQVYDTYYAVRTENTPTFLNIGAKYPDQKLTVVIWATLEKNLKAILKKYLKTKKSALLGS